MLLVLALLLPLAVALGAVDWCRPEKSGAAILRLSLAYGLGVGLSSCLFFLWSVLFWPGRAGFVFAESALYLLLLVPLFFRYGARRVPPMDVKPPEALPSTWRRVVFIGFLVTVTLGLVSALTWQVLSPDGDWDAFAIWNFHARFLYRGGEHWTDYLTYNTYGHPDYPLLMPGAVARAWTYLGHESTFEHRLLDLLFLAATCGLLGGALATFRSATQGLLAVMVLASTSLFVEKGTSQYSDIPLAFFFLASAVLLTWHDETGTGARLPALAGAAAGFATWTKNEGMMFLLALLLARAVVVIRAHGLHTWLKELRAFSLGLLPALACLIYFKARLAPTNDLVAGQGLGPTLERLLSPSRYVSVAGGLLGYGLLVGPGAVLVLIIYGCLLGKSPGPRHQLAVKSIIVIVAMMLSGYTVVYLTTPHDLWWHLSVLDRLYMQLWPLTLFGFFLWVKSAYRDSSTIPELAPYHNTRL